MSNQDTNSYNAYLSQLYDRLEKRSKSFSNLFKSTAIFSFAFLAFVLVPLVALQHDGPKIEQRLKDMSEKYNRKKVELEKLSQRVKNLENDIAQLSVTHDAKAQELLKKEEEVQDINQRIEEIELRIDKNASEYNLFEEKAGAFVKIRQKADNLPEYDSTRNVQKLRNSLAHFVDDLDGRNLSSLPPDGTCRAADLSGYVQCKTKETILAYLEEYRSVIHEADAELADYVKLGGEEHIEKRISSVLEFLDQQIQGTPNFWNTIRGKIFFFDGFNKPMEEVLKELKGQLKRYKDALDEQKIKIVEYGQKLKSDGDQFAEKLRAEMSLKHDLAEQIKNMEQAIRELMNKHQGFEQELQSVQADVESINAEAISLEAKKQEIAKAKESIKTRLEKVESPFFGTLPIGLNEAVLAFPVIIAVGVLLYGYTLAELIHLRKAYHLVMRNQNPADVQQIDGRINLVLPVWIDPMGEKNRNRRRTAILFLPVLAYCLALILTVYSWLLTDAQYGSAGFIRGVYLVLYLSGITGFYAAFRRIYMEWKHYRGIVPETENT